MSLGELFDRFDDVGTSLARLDPVSLRHIAGEGVDRRAVEEPPDDRSCALEHVDVGVARIDRHDIVVDINPVHGRVALRLLVHDGSR